MKQQNDIQHKKPSEWLPSVKNRMTFRRMTFSRKTLSIMTFIRTTFSRETLSRMPLGWMTFNRSTPNKITFSTKNRRMIFSIRNSRVTFGRMKLSRTIFSRKTPSKIWHLSELDVNHNSTTLPYGYAHWHSAHTLWGCTFYAMCHLSGCHSTKLLWAVPFFKVSCHSAQIILLSGILLIIILLSVILLSIILLIILLLRVILLLIILVGVILLRVILLIVTRLSAIYPNVVAPLENGSTRKSNIFVDRQRFWLKQQPTSQNLFSSHMTLQQNTLVCWNLGKHFKLFF